VLAVKCCATQLAIALDSLLERARSFTKRTAALAREEVEDMVAEAKELKQREQV
jgi:hypothetical protein